MIEPTLEDRLRNLMLQHKPAGAPVAHRRRLPDERRSVTHKFSIVGKDGYITVGEYEDGSLGELFLRFEKEPGTISEEVVRDLIATRNALLDQFAVAVSLLLQVGYPLDALVRKFRHAKFPPQGFTGNEAIPSASSPTDYVFAWLEKKYLRGQEAPAPAPRALLSPPAEVKAIDVGAAGCEFVRCPGDGVNGCGHDAHEGPCPSNAYGLNKCSCQGTPK